MKDQALNSVLPVFVLCAALSACGGGGSSAPNATTPPPQVSNPPTETSVQGAGVLTKFGASFSSVTVNGTSFDTTANGLTVSIDDQPSTLDQLSVGDVVTVIASSTDNGVSASARQIIRGSNLEGPIAAGSIDLATQTLVVLGQTVRVTPATLFDDSISPRSLDGLSAGDQVEISGMADGNGVITASRIEARTTAGLFEVQGTVSSLDSASQRFNLADLVVDYSSASVRDFASGAPDNGDVVEVKGSTFGSNGELIATDVESKNPAFAGTTGDLVEIEGFVTRFASAADFDVAGLPVTTNSQTEFERGTASDLGPNVHLEAEGSLNGSGVLVARKIEYKTGADNAQVKIEASVDAVNAGAGTLTVLGLTVFVDGATLLEDKSDADLSPFGLSDINSGDYVQLRGFEDPIGSANVTAVQLERDDFDSDTILQGGVDSVSQPGLVILGIAIDTIGATRFENASDQVISAGEFFAAVNAGRVVKAKGSFNGTVLIASEIELEDQ